jgi:hypothetical protein
VRISRRGVGERIAAGAGALLLIALFLPWYGWELVIADVELSGSVSAWEVLSVVDVMLCLIALVAIAIPAARAAGGPPADRAGALLLGAGALGLLLVAFRLLDLPLAGADPVAAGDRVEIGRSFGILLALIASAGIAYGGWRTSGERPAQRPDAPR